MGQKLFEFAVLYHPTSDNGKKKKQPSKIIVKPTVELANDEAAVAMKAARAIPDTYADQLDNVEVIVRPF